MSLFKQLFIAICVLMLVNFAGSFLITLESSREQQVSQLRMHAQDTATALGLSLAPYVGDPRMLERIVGSIFQGGYFQSIRVIDTASERDLLVRSGVPQASVAPDWFAGLVGLQPARAEASVDEGGRAVARVEVVSHPLSAVDKLWQGVLANLLWLAVSGTLCVVLGCLLLRRQLRPLEYMVEQSKAIVRREFLSQPELPRTPEFRRVVEAMNQMVEKLKTLFAEEAARSERLRDEAYRDGLTGLANRRHFDMQLHARLSVEDQACSGFLILLRINDLAGLNQRLGGQRTDRLLKAVAGRLQALGQGRFFLARNRGGEFAVLGAGLQHAEAEQLAQAIDEALSRLQRSGDVDVLPVAHIGLSAFAPGDDMAELYRALDLALAEAEAQVSPHWAFHRQGESPASGDQGQYWWGLLDGALRDGRFQLYFQPLVDSADPGRVLHHKVMARLRDERGELLPAGRFLPWLERFGWMPRLDLAMLGWVLAQMRSHERKLALSISGHLLRDAEALDQLYALLERNLDLGARLTLELGEEQLPDAEVLEALGLRLRGLGFGLGLQHFGGRFSMIGNLARLGLSYLKVDGSYIRAIDKEDDKRLFIETMQRAANSIDLPLLAERVETEGEWRTLRDMGISGVQGRLFGEPAPWRER